MELTHLVHRPVRARSGLPPSPWLPVAACALTAGGLFGLGVAGGLAGTYLLVTPITVALFGVLLAVRRVGERARARAQADAWISRGYESRASRYGWRVEELVSWHERKLLAGSVRGILTELAPARLPGASPLNRPALRPHSRLIAELADRVADMGRPVSAAGILAVHRLLTSPESCLYTRSLYEGRRPDVARELTAVLDRLEVPR